jgi:tetratricopeptide (TPR) repeat protein
LVLGLVERNAGVEQAAVNLANEGDWAAAAPIAAQAADAEPRLAPYVVTHGLAAMAVGDPATARGAFTRAAAADELPQTWLDLAAVELETGDAAAARQALDQALRLGEQQPLVAYAAGWLLDRLGDEADADAMYVSAVADIPSLAGDPSWASDALADRWPAILDKAMEANLAFAWEMALVSGDPSRAASLAVTSADPELAGMVIRAWEGDGQAVDEIDALARQHPLNLSTITWAGRLHSRLGDEEVANDYRRWAEYINGGASAGAHEVRVGTAEAARQNDARAGNLATFYGHYAYRRPTPWDLLVPGLPRLVYE